MRYEEAIELLISATNSEQIAKRTLQRASKDIERATKILIDSMEVGVPHVHGGYVLMRGRRRNRRYVDNEKLLTAWENLPKKVRDKFDSSFQGTVAELEDLMGREDAATFLSLSLGPETILVKEVLEEEPEKPERVDFRG
jgi:hypothetical protein